MADLEIILVADNFLNEIGLRKKLKLELNSLGNKKVEKYIESLTRFLKKKKEAYPRKV